MTDQKRTKPNTTRKVSVVWVSFTLMDISLNKMALLDISRYFSRLGHKSSLVVVRSRDNSCVKNQEERIISLPMRYVSLISPIAFAIVMWLFLPIFIIAEQPDFIIMDPGVHILSAFSGMVISKFRGPKFVLDVRSTPVETIGLRGFLQRFWFSVSVVTAKKLFDGITIITPLMKEEICNNFDINPDDVGVWTSGVSDSLFDPEISVPEGLKLKRQLGLSGKFVVLYHGVFSATRGLTETIEATRILRQRHPNIVLFLLGTGPFISALRTLILACDLKDNVLVHNPVDQSEVPQFIGMCDVCIAPLPHHAYWRFQCPLKLLESLAMEKVVVASDIPAHRLVIGDKRCGIYISSVNPIEIVRSLEYAFHNRNKLEDWGKIGRTIIKQKYTWEKVARDLENFLLHSTRESH